MTKIVYALFGLSCGEILDDESVYLLQTKTVASIEDSLVEYEGNNGRLRVAGACDTFQCPNGYDMTCSRDVSQTNVARGKRVSGSSESKWGSYSEAVDGRMDRGWHSSNGRHTWLQIDLGAEYTISGMKTTTGNHYDYAAKRLNNRAAGNDGSMKIVNQQYGCKGVSCQNNFEGWSFPTRYIKMDLEDFWGKGPDHCIDEWEVYGTPTCDEAKCCTQSTTPTTATTTIIPGGNTNPGGADCFGAIASWGPDFDCNEKSDMFCGNDSPDGMDVDLCCQDHCGTRQETRSKQAEAEGDRKQGEGTRKSSRQESSSKRKDAESARKKQRKEDEWVSKRGAQEGKNKNTEDERKNKKGFTEGTKKNERSWKSNRGAAKQAAAKRERTRKRERSNKKNGNAESERLSKQSTTSKKERNKKAARATKKAKERAKKAARR